MINKYFLLVFIISLPLIACTLVEITRPNLPPIEIVYVTVTPAPSPQPTSPSLPLPPANKLGKIMVLEYHKIGTPEQRYQRTPANLKADLDRLHQAGYYPVNFINLINGLHDMPAGKKPIVITFDDSDISQFKALDDGSIAPNSAVRILVDFHQQHPESWPLRATFFVMGNNAANHLAIFGQPQFAKAKLQFLVDMGMEIGSHTVNHTDLSLATADKIQQELALSKHVIESLVPNYTVQSLAVPFGTFPNSLDLLKTGQWTTIKYTYTGNAAAWGGPSPSPFDLSFNPYHVPRIEVSDKSLERWLSYFEDNPGNYYISD